jgi:hypothetical protein
MVNTYTTNFRFINNGDTTIENPEKLVGEQDLIISNAQIQWEGSTTTGSNTSYSTNTNTGSATATTGSSTSTDFNRNNSGIANAYEAPADYTETDTYTDENVIEAFDADSPARSYGRTDGLQSWKDNVESWSITYEAKLRDVYGGIGTFSTNYVKYDTPSSYVEWDGDLDDSDGNWLDIASFSGSGNFPKDEMDMEVYAKDENENDVLEAGARLTVTVEYRPDVVKNETVSATYPPVPDGYNFDYHRREISGESNETITTNKVGDTVSRTSTSTDEYIGITLETHGTKTNYYTNSDTTYVSYPSVPNGYDFDRHYFRIERNGSYQDSDYVYSNNVGSSKSITSNNPSNTWTLEMRTRGETTNYYTNYTQDPSVSGNVSASTGATLNDNETSSWQSLSGFGVGDNSFNHSVSDSGEAYYRIRFDWEYSYPSELAELKFFDGSSQYSVRLADPADDGLDYNTVKAYIEGVGVVALDVVDPSDPDASNFFIYHPTQGVLALRKK